MRKLLSSPVQMNLSERENTLYQNALKHVSEIALNLMAVKVEERPDNFRQWCLDLYDICQNKINMELLETTQLPALNKLQQTLTSGINATQLKMLTVAPWPIYAQFIEQQSTVNNFEERFKFLAYLKQIKHKSLNDMIVEDRLAFAGKHTKQHDVSIYNFDVECFTSTRTAKTFHQLLETYPEKFDQALAHIPVEETVTFEHFIAFGKAFTEIFANHAPSEKISVVIASRLLAMHRPDTFIAVTTAKLEAFCTGFNTVKVKNDDLLGYWNELIAPLQHLPWWKSPAPECATELVYWQHRALLVDLFLFSDPKNSSVSNFIKLKNKSNKPTTRSTGASKRTKASAEELVDKALANEELPDFIRAKRDSIIHQVKEGKTVDQVINLMRAIFG